MRLILTEFVTVDGVMEAPGSEEHRDGRNAWALRRQDPETQAYNFGQIARAEALLFGRTTYQIWEAFWRNVDPSNTYAKRIHDLPKYVVSKTLRRSTWENTTILSGDPAAEVEALKSQPGGELVIYGSADLTNALMAHDLIDEYRLQVFPVILGSGKHLFFDRIALHTLRLVESRTFPSGVVLLVYQPEREEPTTRFVEEYSWTEEQTRALRAARGLDRILATVLFTDIVESTKRVTEMGDRPWRELADRHYELARAEANRWFVQHIESTGDGIMATFETPTRALGCAFALKTSLRDLGLEIRAGLHFGEVERRETGVGGISVHVAARVLAQADPGQVLVTRTVRDLTTGAEFAFASVRTIGLKGVPGEWELCEASLARP